MPLATATVVPAIGARELERQATVLTMTLNELERHRFEKPVKAYIAGRRPPPHIRSELDIGYRFKGQSVEIFEVRPAWRQPGQTIEHSVAKATYVKSRKIWNIFWQRADLKWHRYEPNPSVSTIEDFLAVVDRDQYGCFFG